MHPVTRWERLSFFLLGILVTIHLGARLEDRMVAMIDFLAYIVILLIAYHWTRELDPLERTGRVILYAAGSMFLVRAAGVWLRGDSIELSHELARVSLRYGMLTFMIVWTALVSQSRPPGQYVYNIVFVAPFAMGFGQLVANLSGYGEPRLMGALGRSSIEALALGFAFAYITVGRKETPPEEGKVEET